MGSFTLKVESSHSFDINPIPQEGAGTYSRVIRGSWYSLDVNNELMKLTVCIGTGNRRPVPHHLTNTLRILYTD
jgi:hypothetical protein